MVSKSKLGGVARDFGVVLGAVDLGVLALMGFRLCGVLGGDGRLCSLVSNGE